ncbi:MAG: Asp-tRNA(Asn)/Glu-tRNA(Gln) amidotransferase subunit GatC [Oscillospiraceae bacterium]|nr:Asp-tRNA(Asn)/Glu-tRNA(Gln) amidotransferase subunit GatC [Oscillospiraceae bacterium]
MNVPIDDNLITYLEDLSYLTFSDDEKNRLKAELKDILGCMARLGELNVENVPERSHPFDNVNAFREDDALPSFDRGLILQNAPECDGEAFIAPSAVAG